MTTQQTTWTAFDASDEQIDEITNAKHGYLTKTITGIINPILGKHEQLEYIGNITHYWIIPADPLREMKVRWSQTGQPVWQRYVMEWDRRSDTIEIDCTTTPDWNIPNAEYSFTEFKD